MMIVSEDFKRTLMIVAIMSKCNEELTGRSTKVVSIKMHGYGIVSVHIYHRKNWYYNTCYQFDMRLVREV